MPAREWAYTYDDAHTIYSNQEVDFPQSGEKRYRFEARIGWSSELVTDEGAPYNLVKATFWYRRTDGFRTWAARFPGADKHVFIRCTSDSGNVVMVTPPSNRPITIYNDNSYRMDNEAFVFNTEPDNPIWSETTEKGGKIWQCFGPADQIEHNSPTGPDAQMVMTAKVYSNTARLYAEYIIEDPTINSCPQIFCTKSAPNGYLIQLADLATPPEVNFTSASYDQSVGEYYSLAWKGSATSDTPGSEIDYYELSYSSDGKAVTDSTKSWITLSGYTTGTTYRWNCKADNVSRIFRIRARNKVGQWSSYDYTSPIQARILTPVFTNGGKKLFIEDDTKYNNYATDSAFKKAHNAVKQVKINEKDCHVIANNWKHIVRWTAGQYVYEYRYQIKVWPPQVNAPNVESTPDSEWGHEDTTTALSLQNQNPMNYGAQPGGWIAYRVQAVGLDSPNHSLHSGWIYSLPIRVKGSLLVCQGGWKVAEPKFAGNRRIQQIFVRQFGQWKELY